MVRIQGSEGGPQTQQRVPLAHVSGMEEKGGPPTQQREQTARGKASNGATTTSQSTTPASIQREEEWGNPHELQRAHLMHVIQ